MSSLAATDTTLPARASGRPRSEGCRQKILAAADLLLTRDGFAKMSIDAIAQEAGASKATIYRWWPSKAAIVMEALLELTEADVHVPAGPDPEDEIVLRIGKLIALFRSPKGRVIASIIGQSQFDPEIGEAYRKHLLGPRRAQMHAVINRAIAAGQFREDLDVDLAMDLLYGPIYERLLLGHAPLDESFLANYPPMALAALRGYAGLNPASQIARG